MIPLNKEERKFYAELQNRLKHMEYYRDQNILQLAKDAMPVEDLTIKATLRLSLLEDLQEITFKDCVILELLNWFKNSFFSWFDSPKCEDCSTMSTTDKLVSPTAQESDWGADKVEQYICPICQTLFRFPRYQHPKKLLETRKGRCGEWANCFALFCIALRFETRIVCDYTDHLWIEIYSPERKKWYHCDPCENVFDKPLLYEHGWKKELNYIIAFSTVEVQDVTWRYTTRPQEVLKRRTRCREEFLLHIIRLIQQKLEQRLSPEEAMELRSRRALELARFLTPPKVEDSYEGRTSGSLSWRLNRGEVAAPVAQYVFQLSPEEIERKRFHLKYNCAADVYVRGSRANQKTDQWNTFVFSMTNIYRKVEHDWKMAYLARTDGTDFGVIRWEFDFSASGLVVNAINLRITSRSFENGDVQWTIMDTLAGTYSALPKSENMMGLTFEKGKDCVKFALTAELRGGTLGQHTQIFRQSLEDSESFPFEVEVLLSKAEDRSSSAQS